MADSQSRPISADALRTLALCTLTALAEGFDIQSMGVAAPRMAPALRLAHDQLGPLFSASVVGLLIGALLLGRLADRVGRKWTLVVSLAAFGVFTAATAFVSGLGPLLAVRFLAGLGLGGAMPNLIALAAEALSAEGVAIGRRTRLVTIVTAGMPLGAAVAGIVAATLSWRDIFYVGAAAPLALSTLIAFIQPESRGFQAARRAPAADAGRIDVWNGLFAERRAATTLLLWTATFCGLLSLYLLINWLPTLMHARGISQPNASLVSVLFNLGGAVSALFLATLFEQRRRAAKLAIWYLGMAASIVFLARAGADIAWAGAAGFVAGVFIANAALPFYGLAPGFYRLKVRGAGVGATLAVGRLGAVAGPLAAGALLSAGAGAGAVITALLPLALVIGLCAMALAGRPTVEDEEMKPGPGVG